MTARYPSAHHFSEVVTDRSVEEPWAVARVPDGARVLDVGSATSRYLAELARRCRVYAIDLRPTRPQPGVGIVRGDLIAAPFRPATFDAITCISTIEHVGLDVYGQGADEFGDEVAMRHLRALLRPDGRLLLTAPFGRRLVCAWFRVYDRASFRRLTGGFRPVRIDYYRRDGDAYVPCRRDEAEGALFDVAAMRSGGVVLAELTPAGPLKHARARLSLRLRRTLRRLTHRGPFWTDPWSGEEAARWLQRQEAREREGRG